MVRSSLILNINHYRIRIHLGRAIDYDYSRYLYNVLRIHFNANVRYINQGETRLVLELHSKKILDSLKNYLRITRPKTKNIALKHNLSQYSYDFLKCFVRGVFDTDGCIDCRNSIVFSTISKDLSNNISSILNKFQIQNSIYEPKVKYNEQQLYRIRVKKIFNRQFAESIGSSHPVKSEKIRNATAGIRISE